MGDRINNDVIIEIMKYPGDFINLVYDSKWQGRYVGIGNPEAKILIVGKECALDEKRDPSLYDKTFKQNLTDWKDNVEKEIGFDKIEEWTCNEEIFPRYNPLLPFYKQKFTVLKHHATGEKKGKIRSGEGGTSATWYNYQKVFNMYLERIGKNPNREYIDFFKYCFVTELSEVCRPNNRNLQKEERLETEKSIAKRYELICATSFFQKFDKVILACGKYADKLNIQRMFGNAQIIPTCQLSYAVSDECLRRIANEL